MASEWTQTTIGGVAHRVTKGTTPTTIGGHFAEAGISYVKAESISDDGRFLPDKFAHIDEETNRLLERSVLQEDDVLFTIAGTIGRVARVDSSILPANTNQAVAIIRPNRAAVDPRFLYFALRDAERVQRAHTRVVQSVQANFSLAELSSIELPLPPLAEQRAIAHILGTLDDKIELNRRMSETLEAMARALFKSWFVDFDPVRAKAEGRDPRLPQDIADLFPDSFEDSEIGEIPKHWKVASLADALSIVDGRTLPAEARDEDGPFQAFGANGPMARAAQAWVGTPCIVLGKIGTCGALHRSAAPCWVTNNAFAVQAGTSRSLEFAWHTLQSIDFSNYIGGSANPYMPLKNFGHHLFVLPTPSLLDQFEAVAGGTRRRLEIAAQDSSIVVAIRDALLPRLISGALQLNLRDLSGEELEA